MKLERRIFDVWTHPQCGTPGREERQYCVLGPDMAIAFHFSIEADWGPNVGLEMHYKIRPADLTGQESFEDQCWLTGVQCWEDGASLYAAERLYPLVVHKRGSEVAIDWSVLENEWHRRHRNSFGQREARLQQEQGEMK